MKILQPSEVFVQLLIVMSRVSKPGLTVPRSELVAAEMLVRMLQQVEKARME